MGLSEGFLVEESVWNKGPGAAASSPADRVVSSDPAAAPGVVSGTPLTAPSRMVHGGSFLSQSCVQALRAALQCRVLPPRSLSNRAKWTGPSPASFLRKVLEGELQEHKE